MAEYGDIVFIDPRNRISKGGQDVILRHEKYKQLFTNITKSNICVWSKFENTNSDLEIRNELRFIKLIRFFFKYKKDPAFKKVRLLIAGDPWMSFYYAYFLKKTIFKNSSIQLQIHGDYGHKDWQHESKMNNLKFKIILKSIALADSIRFVGKTQLLNMLENSKDIMGKCFIAPIPSLIFSEKVLKKNEIVSMKRPESIALIGRLHRERGINTFIDLIENLLKDGYCGKILIVGDGPLRRKMSKKIRKFDSEYQAQFLGFLSNSEMSLLWKDIGLIVSVAKYESFCRVAREAAANGVPGIFLRSSGIEDFASEISAEYCRILDSDNLKKDFMKSYHSLINVVISPKIELLIWCNEVKYLDNLIDSWVDLTRVNRLI